MDRKSIIVLTVSFLLLMAWYPLMERLGYVKPPPPRTNQVAIARAPGATGAPPRAVPAPAELRSAPPSPTLPSLAPLPAAPAAGETDAPIVVENAEVRYRFAARGGGIQTAELRGYPEAVECRKRDGGNTNELATLNEFAPVPVLAVLADAALQEDFRFKLTRTPGGVRAEKQFTNGVRLVKEFTLGSNYLLQAVIRFENTLSAPVRIGAHEVVIGTATSLGGADGDLLTGVQWYNGSKAERVTDAWFANRTLGCIPGVPRLEYLGGQGNVAWAAVHNQFFTIAAVPATNASQVVARKVLLETPPSATNGAPAAVRHGYQTGLRSGDRVLMAGQSIEERYEFYFGPKKYHGLASLGARMNNNLDLIMGFDGFFGWFAKALLLSMNAVASFGASYGVAIVLITIVIKLAFWPLTAASTRSMKRMASFQPQMKALQEKYKDDPQKMNQKLMEFMKEHKISPLGGCLPMLLQIPVFFGFYTMLQSAIELRGASFLWACDLSRTDTIFVIPGIGFPVNPLPLLMGVTMLWQARLTPPSPGMDPVQQKIMKYMPLMFMVFLYNFSAGLTLYWTVQNLLSIAQMKFTRGDNSTPATPKPAEAKPPAAPARKKKS